MRTAFGNDLTYYKPTTMDRRIERRMALQKIETLSDYVKFVQSNADELRLLYKDMLISVTSFFRDGESFEALKAVILPRILESKESGGQIRIWVPACSTGEEAYSLAIALFEVLGERAPEFRLADLRHRRRRVVDSARAARYLSAQHRARRLSGETAALLRQERERVSDRAPHPRRGRVLRSERHPGRARFHVSTW